MSRKPDYGIDSPMIAASLLTLGLIFLGCAGFLPNASRLHLRWPLMVLGAYLLLLAFGMLLYSKSGKLQIRDAILASIPFRGDECVLDLGCGRGLLLVGAAKRVPGGRALGVDVWNRHAVTNNRSSAVLENAKIEGVSERVNVQYGDARRLPYNDGVFDVVVSNFLVHELKTAQEREECILEIARVLRPGGHLALADFIFTRQCVDTLRRAGIEDAKRARVGSWLSAVPTLGIFQTFLVTGQKPVASRSCD